MKSNPHGNVSPYNICTQYAIVYQQNLYEDRKRPLTRTVHEFVDIHPHRHPTTSRHPPTPPGSWDDPQDEGGSRLMTTLLFQDFEL